MDLYVLTQTGREAMAALQKKGRSSEASMLEYMDMTDGATVEQIAEFMNSDKDETYNKLRSLCAKRWVWRKTTKLTPF